ncbi:MAG: hypothetical protein UIM53_01115 [Acutalibacteraceae bacterium]|nr:hypothetical protein [Acutalibacteraceae bacterium]
MALPNYEKEYNESNQLIIFEDVNISITTKAGDYVWKSATFSVPAGYKFLSASIIDNGYTSEMVTSIISLKNTSVAVNAYCKSVQTRTVVVRVLFIKI